MVYVGIRLNVLWHVLVVLFWLFSGLILGDLGPQVGKAGLFKIELLLWRRAHFAHFRCLLAGWRLAANLVTYWEGFGCHVGSRCGQAGPRGGQSWAKYGHLKAMLGHLVPILGKDLWQLEQDLIKEGCLDVVCWLLAD